MCVGVRACACVEECRGKERELWSRISLQVEFYSNANNLDKLFKTGLIRLNEPSH